jgi:Flp pilus assembly protein TadG
MRRKAIAQSMVEMAMVLPFLLFLAFAIIDMGWYIYGYGTIYNAARRGAEIASQLPPQINKLTSRNDSCSGAIFKAVQDNAPLFPTLSTFASISYPKGNQDVFRIPGGLIQVQIQNYPIRPLTPLLTLGKAFGFGSVDGQGNAVMAVSITAQRSIESLGQNPNFKNGQACQP